MFKNEGKINQNNERKITDVQWEEFNQNGKPILERLDKEIPSTFGTSKSCMHIIGNLGPICNIVLNYTPDKRTDRKYMEGQKALKSLEKYLNLLRDFPEFKKKELATGKGYFPEKMFADLTASTEYVDAYEAKLRGNIR